ncbi:MAG: HDOD domain-containing protein [Thiotrichales bacterium]|nr:HDOD domain-containing protein [Thiotrichales bacterium]
MKIEMKVGIEEAKKLIQNLKIASIPPEIYELEELMLAERPNMTKIAAVISKNPELLGDFLSLVNKVLNKSDDDLILDALAAVNLLGLAEIENLFLGCYLQKHLPTSQVDHKLILNSMRSGIAAAELSYWVNDISRTEAYFIAFLQDIGAIYMMRYDAQHYAQDYLNPLLTSPFDAHFKEFEHYHTAHTFVGSVIARRWHLGDLLCKTLLLHHQESLESVQSYDRRVAHMVALIQLANALVFQVFSDHYETAEIKQSLENAVAFLKLPDNAIEATLAALKKWGYEQHTHQASH